MFVKPPCVKVWSAQMWLVEGTFSKNLELSCLKNHELEDHKANICKTCVHFLKVYLF